MSLLSRNSTQDRTIVLRGRFFFSWAEEKVANFRIRSPRITIYWELFTSLAKRWENTAMSNIDEEHDMLTEHLHDCAKKAESLKTTKKRLSLGRVELIHQRGSARDACNYRLASELAKICTKVIEMDLKERRAAALAEATDAGKSIRHAHRDFVNWKTRMTALHHLNGTTTSSRNGMEKVIHDYYPGLFDSLFHLTHHHPREDGYEVPKVLSSEIRHAIKSAKNRTTTGPSRIRSEHLKSLPPVIIDTMVSRWEASKTVLLYKKGDSYDIHNYRPICLFSVVYKLHKRNPE